MNQQVRSVLDSVKDEANCLGGLWQQPRRRPGAVWSPTETVAGGTPEVRRRHSYLPSVFVGVALAAAVAAVGWIVVSLAFPTR
jgi:hypothetical protein